MTLVVGLPRPQSARKILNQASSLGVRKIIFFRTDRGESAYAKSRLWTTGEYKRHLLEGVQQAFSTRIPGFKLSASLNDCMKMINSADRIVLDNYEAEISLNKYKIKQDNCYLFVGPENGWSSRERDILRENGFSLTHLGNRVLRTETACVSGITLLLAKMGLI